MKRFAPVLGLILWVGSLSEAARAADLSCLEGRLVVVQDDSDRCNSIPLENKIIHQLDMAARSSENVVTVWGEDHAVAKALGEACSLLNAGGDSRQFAQMRVIWIQDSEALIESFREDLQVRGKSGACGWAVQQIPGNPARVLGKPVCNDQEQGVLEILMRVQSLAFDPEQAG